MHRTPVAGYTQMYRACDGGDRGDIAVIQLLLANNTNRHINTNQNYGPTCHHNLQTHRHLQKHVFESYDKAPLCLGADACNEKKNHTAATMQINSSLSQHQYQLAVKTVLLVQKLPVHEDLVYEILGFLSLAAVEKIFVVPTIESY